jgi:hypothetical protein
MNLQPQQQRQRRQQQQHHHQQQQVNQNQVVLRAPAHIPPDRRIEFNVGGQLLQCTLGEHTRPGDEFTIMVRATLRPRPCSRSLLHRTEPQSSRLTAPTRCGRPSVAQLPPEAGRRPQQRATSQHGRAKPQPQPQHQLQPPLPRLQPGVISVTPLPPLPTRPEPCPPLEIRDGGIRCTYRRAAAACGSKQAAQPAGKGKSSTGADGPVHDGYLHANPFTGAATLYDEDGLHVWSAFLDMRMQGVATLEEKDTTVEGDSQEQGDSELQQLSECVRYSFGDYEVVCEAPDAATAADLAAGYEAGSSGRAAATTTAAIGAKKRRRIRAPDHTASKKARCGSSGHGAAVDRIIAQSAEEQSASGGAHKERVARRVVRDLMRTSWDSLVGMTAHVGPKHENTRRLRAAIFMALPSKKELPDYYKIIAQPTDLNRIRGRIETGWYEPRTTPISKGASKGASKGSGNGSSMASAAREQHGHRQDEPAAPAAAAAAAGTATEGGDSATTTVASVSHWGYRMWCSYEKDIELMFENARQFNQPDSLVVKDADVMWKAFEKKARSKRKEIESGIEAALAQSEQEEQTKKEQQAETRREQRRQHQQEEAKALGDHAEVAEGGADQKAAATMDIVNGGGDDDDPAVSADSAVPSSTAAAAAASIAEPAAEPAASAAAAAAAPSDSSSSWSVHGLVPIELQIVDPLDATRRFRECLTWDLNPGNSYTELECARTICADRGLPSLMVDAVAAAIREQCGRAIFHKPSDLDGEHVIVIRLDLELDCEEEAAAAAAAAAAASAAQQQQRHQQRSSALFEPTGSRISLSGTSTR